MTTTEEEDDDDKVMAMQPLMTHVLIMVVMTKPSSRYLYAKGKQTHSKSNGCWG